MLTRDMLHDYQRKAVNFQSTHMQSALWLDVGLGKTAISLTSASYLIDVGFLKAVLIIAPIRVCRLVWRTEAAKWAHTNHLKFSMVMGTKDQRTRALLKDADFYLCNYENLEWLSTTLHTYFISKGKELPFDGVIWDEVTKLKNSGTHRVSAVKKILPYFKWLTGLTGTPASNGYKDLHGQYLVLDQGVRLGTSKTAFKTRFYRKEGQYKEVPYEDTENTIKQLIGDITLEMSAADYNPLPDLIVNDVMVELPEKVRTLYDVMEKEFFVKLDNGTEVEVFNQASLTNKLLQMGNGFCYPIAGMPLWEAVHDEKLNALEDIIDEAAGQPVLCAYAYRADAERIMKRFAKLSPINLTECKSEKALNDAMWRWTHNECQLMICHPACLHPKTKVLTQRRGWVNIIDVEDSEKVFDGVEFVSHSGCTYSGYKEVIDVFGITMTPDHKLLIDGKWVEGQHARTNQNLRSKALYKYEGNDNGVSKMLTMWKKIRNDSSEFCEAQPKEIGVLPTLRNGQIPLHDQYSDLAHMDGYEMEGQGQKRQELWGSRHNHLSGMVRQFREVLRRYVKWIFGRSDNRENRREQKLQQEKLPMGDQYGATVQQANQSQHQIPGGDYPSGRASSAQRIQQNDAINAIKSRNDWGRSSCGCENIQLRKEQKTDKCPAPTKAHVYDLVDCGPRHQFVIRNDKGEVFISHNSAGHGIDGLQKNGHIIVWYGLTWSLDLCDQLNGRLRRQGQGVPVTCHRILAMDTMDQAQALALDTKATTQASLRNAIKEYRKTREKTNG